MPFMKPPLMLCTTRPKNRNACERRLRSKDVKGWFPTHHVNYPGFHVELEAIVETIDNTPWFYHAFHVA